MRTRLALLAAVLLMMFAAAGVATAVTDPTSGPYAEVHGEMVTGVPATAACTTTVVQDFRFHDTAYGADAPFTGDYVPTCAGPWSKVVLTMSATVKPGTQFDRIGDVLIGGVELLHLTTAEGEAGETSWSIQRDVTDVSSVLRTRQPAYFIIGNQTDSTYTGDFYGTLTLSFYAGAKPASVADQVLSLSPGIDRGLPTRSGGAPLVSRVTVPRNTTALTAQVFASGHGAEEEDWWNAPYACASGGVPYREVGVSVDGRLAGIAPVFPTIYTGGYGPDFWRPFPSPRAFDVRPYDLDLTPFVGQLTDGRAHSIAIATIGQGGCDGYWFLGGNLLVDRNPVSRGTTVGRVTALSAPAAPTSTSSGTQGAASDSTTSSHQLTVTGTVRPAGARRSSVVTVTEDLANNAVDAALDVDATWTWDSSTTRSGAPRTSQHSEYDLVRSGPTWTLTDDQDTALGTFTTTLQDSMTTGGSVVGVTGLGGTSEEHWRWTTSAGLCADHQLLGAAQNVLQDQVSSDCSTPYAP